MQPKMTQTLRVYLACQHLRLKTMWTYRLDFVIGAFAYIVQQALVLLFLDVVIKRVGTLQGWDFWELAFLYGLLAVPRSLTSLFANSLWILGLGYVRNGQLDRLLLRPINTLAHLLSDHFYPQWIGQILTSIIILVVAAQHINIQWSVGSVALLLLFLASGIVIYFSLLLAAASTGFWIGDNYSLLILISNMAEFGRYPISIYPMPLQVILTWIIPIAFATVLPSSFLLGNPGARIALWAPLVAFLTAILAYGIWRFGLRYYQGAGT